MCNAKAKTWLISSFVVCALAFPLKGNLFAQATKQNSGDVACAASGSSTQVLAQNMGRVSYLLNNINNTAVRVGYVNGSGTPNLTTSNSWVLQPGQAIGDSLPNVNSSRIVCMSTGGSTNTITFYEGYR